jgi:hypothetical protein
MADKDFRVKNRLHVNGLSQNSGVILATNNALDAHTNLPTQYGGTGTTTSPSAGQVLYSSGGTTYAPTAISSIASTSSGTETLTNKTISLGSNTVSGTISQFNTALSDANFSTTLDDEDIKIMTYMGAF